MTSHQASPADTHTQVTQTAEAKQPQFPQPLLIRLVLQTLHQLRCPSLDKLQHLNVLLVVRDPKLHTVFEVQPHHCQVQGNDHFPSPAGHTIFDTSQDAVGLLGPLGTLLAHIQAAVNQHPQVLLCQAAFQPLFPNPVALHRVVVAQVQDPALSLVEPHTIGLGPSIQPVQVPLQSLPTLKQINIPTQFGIICKLTEGALDPFVQIIDKDIKQDWPQHRALGNTTCDRLPTGITVYFQNEHDSLEKARHYGTEKGAISLRVEKGQTKVPVEDKKGFIFCKINERMWLQCAGGSTWKWQGATSQLCNWGCTEACQKKGKDGEDPDVQTLHVSSIMSVSAPDYRFLLKQSSEERVLLAQLPLLISPGLSHYKHLTDACKEPHNSSLPCRAH
ncbi:hypothetical protein QYF61_018145 [Mycteria americana]|uniref:Uncharacterized protein n=1 Tax=Mycteria americana TaxID=33587 RepID=A0AAN7NMD7_MYCAM|nr:hypothetical protein QYF61_018145 [Mycteria americana]